MPKTNSEIRIIGARSSGKTTYLATLLSCPDGLVEKYPGLRIEPGNDEAQKLKDLAEDILKQRAKLAGNAFDPSQLHNLRYYDLHLKIPEGKKQGGKKQRSPIDLELTARDFPGEFFQDIPKLNKQKEIKTWIEDLFTTTGWMVMVTDWEPEYDTSIYEPAFRKLCQEISERERINPEVKNIRIAVVMAKCERGELWPCRLDPDEDLFEIRLPKTYQLLTQKLSPQRLQFFACSAFGVLCDRREGYDPRPNCHLPDDGSPEEFDAYLKESSQWYPYGLIPPLYWLATGIRIEE